MFETFPPPSAPDAEKCACGVVPFEDDSVCQTCDGSGDDGDPLSWHGCLSCRGTGFTTKYLCDCDPYSEDDDA